MITAPTERKWLTCPHCGAKHSIYDNTANCNGVFLKCTRGCKNEFELIIENGVQVSKKSCPVDSPQDVTRTVHRMS